LNENNLYHVIFITIVKTPKKKVPRLKIRFFLFYSRNFGVLFP
jgi:hypothetical protein